ncbi:hypothetical protein MMC31_007552 [Peltigera leucophlebia]|nr:hypothetical protein [Peltigera leucophlebia]
MGLRALRFLPILSIPSLNFWRKTLLILVLETENAQLRPLPHPTNMLSSHHLLHRMIIFLSLSILLGSLYHSTTAAPTPAPALVSLNPRSTHYNNLSKRGCIPSKESPPTWNCSPDVPSIAEIEAKIREFGRVGSRDSLFYNGFGGGGAIAKSKCWYDAKIPKPNRGYVMFDEIVDPGWDLAQGAAIFQGPRGSSGLDAYQKRESQAFAQLSQGTVYFLTPKGNTPGADTAWAGWEFPALTRNTAVDQVIRVDPEDNSQQIIWSKGDPPTPNEPRG